MFSIVGKLQGRERMAEPFFEKEPTALEIMQAFNWFAENKSWADSKKYIIEYLINNDMKDKADIIKKQPEYEISWVSGWICRLLSKKSKISNNDRIVLDQFIANIKEKT